MKVLVLTSNKYFEIFEECRISSEVTTNASIVFTAQFQGEKVILINTAFESYLIRSSG